MRRFFNLAVLMWLVPSPAVGADLAPDTVQAYERYIADIERQFAPEVEGRHRLEEAAPATLARLRAGEIISWPGSEDGILKAPDGLIHHWRGAAFIPGVRLSDVLAVAQNYPRYVDMYEWIVHSDVVDHRRERDRDRYWLLLRIHRSASMVTSVVDIWSQVEYRYARADRATAVSNAECVRQVEDAGKADERRLPPGQGSGYLWRANTYSAYLERDGGVYVDLQTVGLSRGFPRLLGWLIEPIARQIGRGSAADSLKFLRDAVGGPAAALSAIPAQERAVSPSWCGS